MTAPHTQCQPDITLVQDLRMDADMLKDGYQKNLTDLWHSDVVREAAKNALRAADRIEELTKALEEINRIVHVPTKETSHRNAERHFMADFDTIRRTCSVSLEDRK